MLRLDDVLSPQSQSQLLLLLLGETEVDVLRLDDVVLSSQSQLLLLLLSVAVEEEVLILVEYKELVDGLVERLETEDKVLEVVSARTANSNWCVSRTQRHVGNVGKNRDKFDLSPAVCQPVVVSFTHTNLSVPTRVCQH